MRKSILLAALLFGISMTGLQAQNLFDFEHDTVCIRQQVNFISHIADASSYYWGFCSAIFRTIP